jgi:hypothetical protein
LKLRGSFGLVCLHFIWNRCTHFHTIYLAKLVMLHLYIYPSIEFGKLALLAK